MPQTQSLGRTVQSGRSISHGDAMFDSTPISNSLFKASYGRSLSEEVGFQHVNDSLDVSFVDTLASVR
jgi:hypothetical protein